MKKLMLIVVLIFTVQLTQGQITDTISEVSKQEMYEYFFSKHKKQNKTGLILLGSGLVAIGAGIIIMNNSGWLEDEWTYGGLLYSVGILTTISSIPVLIISGSNKRKAETYVQIGEYRQMDFAMPDSNVYSVGIKIEF